MNNQIKGEQKDQPSNILSSEQQSNENDKAASNLSIRPPSLKEYIGQEKIKKQLYISIKAAKMRNEALDHTLFSGPPGLGKTTLARIIAHEMSTELLETSGPALEKPADIAALLVKLEKNDVLFIDEIHRLSPVIEEVLYPAMEDGFLDIVIGDNDTRRSIHLNIAPFTLVGATTKQGSLSSPLHDRFGMLYHIDFYDADTLYKILLRSSKILNVSLPDASLKNIAKRARGTPRIANRLLRRVRDFIQVKLDEKDESKINQNCIEAWVEESLSMLGVNSLGMTQLDVNYLSNLHNLFSDGPVGVKTLATSLAESLNTLEDVVEPFLLQQGYIARTSQGRILTNLGKKVQI